MKLNLIGTLYINVETLEGEQVLFFGETPIAFIDASGNKYCTISPISMLTQSKVDRFLIDATKDNIVWVSAEKLRELVEGL